MRRHALPPVAPTREQVLVAVPERATDWTIAATNRGSHRLLVPIDTCLRGIDALRYIGEHLADHVAGVHLVNVQKPILTGNVTPLVTARDIGSLRRAAGERVLGMAREAFQSSAIPTTSEVAFGDAAETICRVAREQGSSGIVIAKAGFELHELIRGSVAARVLRMASVPVTVVSSRTAAELASKSRDAECSNVPAEAAEWQGDDMARWTKGELTRLAATLVIAGVALLAAVAGHVGAGFIRSWAR
jgi:nucleotide-binding universal stress UspA family protein